METHVIYYGLRRKNRIVALSSCETDAEFGLVEMTDFATDPQVRGAGVAFMLLEHMETEMREQGYRIAYTIARAGSFGMNITFARPWLSIRGHIAAQHVYRRFAGVHERLVEAFETSP